MKRGFLRILTVVLVLALCFSVSAPVYADNAGVEKVKVSRGDTLTSLCAARGLDLNKCKDVIMQLNGYTDVKQLDRILVGDVIALPATGKSTNTSASSVSGDAFKAAIASTPITSSTAAASGDAVSYYIVVYTLNYGDTLDGIYTSWGLSYSTYAATIARINSSVNLNALSAGQTLFLPVSKASSNYQVSYTVFEHAVRSGETMTSICTERGVDLNGFGGTLQLFNYGLDFGKIIVGQKIYYPASGSAATAAAPVYTAASVSAVAPAQQAASAVQQTAAVQQVAAAQKAVPKNPALQNINELYVGYGVVISMDDYLCVRLETEGFDVYLTYTASSLNGYKPRPGDYAKCIFTPTDFLLASINYVYNVFEQ